MDDYKSKKTSAYSFVHSQSVFCFLQFLSYKEILRFQTVSKRLYEDYVPRYCVNGDRQHQLQTFQIDGEVQKSHLYIPRWSNGIFYEIGLNLPQRNYLKWVRKSAFNEQAVSMGVKAQLNLKSEENVSVHLRNGTFLIQNNLSDHYHINCYISQQNILFDSKRGLVQEVAPMSQPRTDHSLVKIGDYAYALGGRQINYLGKQLNTCERLNFRNEDLQWQSDMPNLAFKAPCMTAIKAHHTFIYAFTYLKASHQSVYKGLILQRLDTQALDSSKKRVKWDCHQIVNRCFGNIIGNPVVLPLNKKKQNIQRYLILLGQSFAAIWCEECSDISQSYLEELTEEKQSELQLPFNDCMLDQPIYSSQLPGGVRSTRRDNISDNLAVFVGKKSVQIFDIDQEKWVFESQAHPFSEEELQKVHQNYQYMARKNDKYNKFLQ